MAEELRAKTNRDLVLHALVKHGGRTSSELVSYTGLSKDQVKYALKDLKHTGRIILEGNSWYMTSSRLEPYLINRLWNKKLFKGVTL